MRVKDIIATLQERYGPDEQIVVAWWDRNLFLVPDDLDETGHRQPTPEEWNEAVDQFERRGFGDHTDTVLYDTVFEYVYDVACEVTA